jgi:hypothetical protein
LRACFLVATVILSLGTDAVAQDDIKLFNLTDISGHFSARYWFDERNDESQGYVSAAESTRWHESLNLRARSYIYHPAFLEMLFSAVPLAVQSEGSSEFLFGYDVTLNALSRKRYPFTVFFRQEYPDTSTGSAGRFQVETNNYGIQGFFRPIRSPVFLSWRAARRDSYGAGYDAIVDTNSDSAGLNVSLPYGDGQSLKLQVNWDRTESRNGSPGLPIFETSSTSRASRLDNQHKFGAEQQISLQQSLTRLQQTVSGGAGTELESWNYSGVLRMKHSSRHASSGAYRFNDTDRNGELNRSHGLSANTNFQLSPRLRTSARGRFSKNEGNGFSQQSRGVGLSANFKRDIPIGTFSVSGSINMDRRDQETTRDSASVFDEPATLIGFDPVQLQEDFVVVETIVVTNSERTQTFIEDIDYRIVTVGASTTIERLIDGNILEGQVVLVSYEFLTGGTVEYGRVSQSVTSNLNMPRFVNVYVSIANTENEVLSGSATTPLNDSRRYEVGVSKTHSFNTGWSFSGEARVANIEEDISPFVRSSFTLSVGLPSRMRTGVRLGIIREIVDYRTSREDVDKIRYTITANSRLPGGLFLSYRGTLGENDGGTIFREDERHNVQLSWRYRRVSFLMNAIQSEVIQGDRRRKDIRVTANVARFF